ncbi:MAG: hypothetical protein HZA06_02320 [Nitrospirae bacterium]|nr:hypothetical protein [Nitrospirota bacterium]
MAKRGKGRFSNPCQFNYDTLNNNKPRKCLDYKTPSEVFNSSVALAG